MPLNTDGSHTRQPREEDALVTVQTTGGEELALTLNEFRLVLLCLIDFDGDWEALQGAAGFVVDGQGKRDLIRDRLAPIAPELPAVLERGIDSLEVLAARHWFRHTHL